MTSLSAYCLDWHVTASDAFRKLLVEPLAGEVDVVLRPWDGESLADPMPDRPTIFCQLPPPASVLQQPTGQAVWVPMWDHAARLGRNWWESLPSWLRVVAFSSGVEGLARAAGLRTLRLRYFVAPSELVPARWDDGPVVSYWNRTGLVGPRFLEEFCAAIGARELLFREQVDPFIRANAAYALPDRVGGAAVTRLEPLSREEFLRVTERANVVVAPRAREGVGLVLLEAMTRGCCVFAFDAPTMNEYVTSGRNGVLLGNPLWSRMVFNRRWAGTDGYALTHHRRWSRIASLDLERLGRRARSDHIEGHREWLASLPRYRDFLLGG
jgi:glycosyltransferase involved in cell wall biosynthesis